MSLKGERKIPNWYRRSLLDFAIKKTASNEPCIFATEKDPKGLFIKIAKDVKYNLFPEV